MAHPTGDGSRPDGPWTAPIERARGHIRSGLDVDAQLHLYRTEVQHVGEMYRPTSGSDADRFNRAVRRGQPVARGSDATRESKIALWSTDPTPYQFVDDPSQSVRWFQPVTPAVHPHLAPSRPLLLVALYSAIAGVVVLLSGTSAVTAALGVALLVGAGSSVVIRHARIHTRGELTGTFQSVASEPVPLTRDEQQLVDSSVAAVVHIRHRPAWRSEVLASPRAQVNLDEEAVQIARSTMDLATLRAQIGERPDLLGENARQLWQSRIGIYEDGLKSLRQRAEALVSLRLVVDDVADRLEQIERLHDPAVDELLHRVVRAMPQNELAADHLEALAANASGAGGSTRLGVGDTRRHRQRSGRPGHGGRGRQVGTRWAILTHSAPHCASSC